MATRKHVEPERPTRPSTLVSQDAVPAAIKARQELEQLLRVHDPEGVPEVRSRIMPEQLPLVRRIALDRAPEGEGLAARKHAIALLASLGAIEDLNLLSELARFDSEPAIRAEALIGLGRSGVEMAAPVLAEAMGSADGLEATAASKALSILAGKVGLAAARVQVERAPAKGRKLALVALDQLAKPAKVRPPKRSESRRDPQS